MSTNADRWTHPALREPVLCETKHRLYELVGPSEDVIGVPGAFVSIDLRCSAAWSLARYLAAFPDPKQAIAIVNAALALLNLEEEAAR